jgi:hypothetical protein
MRRSFLSTMIMYDNNGVLNPGRLGHLSARQCFDPDCVTVNRINRPFEPIWNHVAYVGSRRRAADFEARRLAELKAARGRLSIWGILQPSLTRLSSLSLI